jgi:hypothetical protein
MALTVRHLMGIKPAPMTSLSYPAEWLLDVFNGRARTARPYQLAIETPRAPWLLRGTWLQNGWKLVGVGLLAIAILTFCK